MSPCRCCSRIPPVAGLAVLLVGCTAPHPTGTPLTAPSLPPPAVEHTAAKSAEATPPVPVPDVLTLADALLLAVQGNPALAASARDVQAAEARMRQAALPPNPELEVEIDEVDRDGAGFDSAETAIVIGQTFELGGKRGWRRRVARAESELAAWDYASKRLDLCAETARRFHDVLAAQARLELARAAQELAEQTNRAVAERVKAGKEPPLQVAKSQAERELARLDAAEAEATLASARRQLAACWGASAAAFARVQGDLNTMAATVPPLEVLRSSLMRNPDLARWETAGRLQRAALAEARAGRIPDLHGSVGFVQYKEDGTEALAFRVGLPLPLFDRNQGNIAAAAHDLDRTEDERRAATLALNGSLAEAHAALASAHQRVVALRDMVLPAMERTYQAAREGYEQGTFGLLDVLDAQRILGETQVALLEAQSGYHRAVVEIQRLTAGGMDAFTKEWMED